MPHGLYVSGLDEKDRHTAAGPGRSSTFWFPVKETKAPDAGGLMRIVRLKSTLPPALAPWLRVSEISARPLPTLLDQRIEAETAVLIARGADCNAR